MEKVPYGNLFTILSLIAVVLVPIRPVSAAATPSVCPYVWSRNLSLGSTGDDVKKLQQFLNIASTTHIANVGPGSPGHETTRYGIQTKIAVAKLQEAFAADILVPHGLSKGSGQVGVSTRNKLNALCGGQVLGAKSSAITAATVPPVIDPDVLTVTKSAQPTAVLAPAEAGGVPFTVFTLTAGSKEVIVRRVVVERVGAGADGVFDSVGLTDETGSSLGDEHLMADHKATFGDDFTIPAHTTKTLTIVGDIAESAPDYDGQMPVLQVDSIDASSPVVGMLPIAGTPQTINGSIVIGSAQAAVSPFDPGNATNRYIGDTGVRFSGIRLTAESPEDLTLSSITWDQIGSVSQSDLTNVVTVINDVAYPTTIDGHTYTSNFAPGIIIKKGESIDAYIQGDLALTGSNRTVQFDIHSSDDIALTGNTFGWGVGVSPSGNTAQSGNSVFITSTGDTDGDEGTPFFSGSVATINGATLISIGK